MNNEIGSNEYALLVYVAQKLPTKDIYPGYIIPKEFMGLKTEVIDPLSYFSSPVFDSIREHIIADDLRNIDWGRLHDLHMPNASQVRSLIAIVRDFGDICVVD